jgi:myo-inositol-1(or 4)-monophosphatase
VARAPEELLRAALEVAELAGALALEGFGQSMRVREKGWADLVTDWDLDCERLIRRELAARVPEIPIFGEEEGGARGADRLWYADPIDGTTNYVHGHPFWCVSIGLVEAGEPVLGAVVAPALGRRWYGARRGSALKNGEPCHVSSTAQIEHALLATGFPRDRETEPDNNFSSFFSAKRVVQGVRRCGSAAIDLCLVADGTYDGYWERRLNPWDLAAGAAIVLAAGGRLSDLAGGPARVESGAIIASNGRVHDALVSLIVR